MVRGGSTWLQISQTSRSTAPTTTMATSHRRWSTRSGPRRDGSPGPGPPPPGRSPSGAWPAGGSSTAATSVTLVASSVVLTGSPSRPRRRHRRTAALDGLEDLGHEPGGERLRTLLREVDPVAPVLTVELPAGQPVQPLVDRQQREPGPALDLFPVQLVHAIDPGGVVVGVVAPVARRVVGPRHAHVRHLGPEHRDALGGHDVGQLPDLGAQPLVGDRAAPATPGARD